MKLTEMGKVLYPLSLIIMISIISGCTLNSDSPEQLEQTTTPGKVTLKVVESLMTPLRTVEFDKIIEQFEMDNPNIEIVRITPDYDTADQTILSMLEQQQKVDIVEVRDVTVHQLAARGLITSLESYISSWSNYMLLNNNAKLMSRDVGDVTFYIPSSLYQVMLYYRKDWFDAKALQIPETWEQLFFVGKQLTKPEEGIYGFSFRGGRGAANTLSTIIQDYNGKNVSISDSMFKMDGTTIYSGDHAAEAIELYRKIYAEISDPASIDWGFNEQVQAFVNGKAALLIQDSDVMGVIKEKLKNNQWATAPLPTGPDGISHYNMGAAGWGIASGSKHKDEAWKFISYLSSIENNRAFADASGVISIYNNTIEEEKYSTGPYAPYMLMANNPDRFQGVKKPSHYKNYSDFFQMGTDVGRQYLMNTISTEELLKQFDVFWQQQRKPEGD
ncbi:ABC transporter substrate-binding protein [Bacillus sp. FJAT-28004]|uniref:ABC transporter substrate-binding protein n=1 Tax=Bacillus sp. FJAT-28004 TaxID=1679165 RepID=UPI0006B5DE61|nr:sugar ABC transporter substrate-binding protein [Bacillus sp. FJAT-28004]